LRGILTRSDELPRHSHPRMQAVQSAGKIYLIISVPAHSRVATYVMNARADAPHLAMYAQCSGESAIAVLCCSCRRRTSAAAQSADGLLAVVRSDAAASDALVREVAMLSVHCAAPAALLSLPQLAVAAAAAASVAACVK
jgi:hypothetical protein